MLQAYAAIGRAVFAAQLFETALVPIFEFFKMNTEPGYIERTGGYVRVGAFKVPIRTIVKTRWMQEHGWPDDDDAAGFAPIIELANRVELEAKELTKLFVGYVLRYASPDSASEHGEEERREKVAQLFHRAHLDG